MVRRQGAYRPQGSDLRLRSLNLIQLIMKDLQDFFDLKKLSLYISYELKLLCRILKLRRITLIQSKIIKSLKLSKEK